MRFFLQRTSSNENLYFKTFIAFTKLSVSAPRYQMLPNTFECIPIPLNTFHSQSSKGSIQQKKLNKISLILNNVKREISKFGRIWRFLKKTGVESIYSLSARNIPKFELKQENLI